MNATILIIAAGVVLLMVGCGGPDLDDKETLDKIIAEAIDDDKLQKRGKEGEKLYYNVVNENGVLVEYLHDGTEKRRATYKDGEVVEDDED